MKGFALGPWVTGLLLVGCAGDKTTEDATDQTDTEDTDDTDDPAGAVTATGTWTGSCEGEFVFGTGATTYTYPIEIASTFDLTDTDGAVAGDWTYTQYYSTTTTTETTPYTASASVEGERVGSELTLEVVPTTTTTTTTASLEFLMTLAGDEMSGNLHLVDYYGMEHDVPCTLTR